MQETTEAVKAPKETRGLAGPVAPLYPERHIREYDLAWELRDTPLVQRGCRDDEGRLFLYGRELAQTLLLRLKPQIEQLPSGEVLLLRLDGIRITPEFADEMVYNLVCRDDPRTRLVKEKIILLANPDEGTKIGLHLALEKEKDAAMVLETGPRPWKLWYIGKIQPHLLSILEYVRCHEPITSKELASEFSFKLADASRRLKELYEDGLIRRIPAVSEDGRLTFTYSYFHPEREAEPGKSLEQLPYALYQPVRAIGASMHSGSCD